MNYTNFNCAPLLKINVRTLKKEKVRKEGKMLHENEKQVKKNWSFEVIFFLFTFMIPANVGIKEFVIIIHITNRAQ